MCTISLLQAHWKDNLHHLYAGCCMHLFGPQPVGNLSPGMEEGQAGSHQQVCPQRWVAGETWRRSVSRFLHRCLNVCRLTQAWMWQEVERKKEEPTVHLRPLWLWCHHLPVSRWTAPCSTQTTSCWRHCLLLFAAVVIKWAMGSWQKWSKTGATWHWSFVI